MTEPTAVAPPQAGQAPLNRLWLLALLPAGAMFGVVGGFMQEHSIKVGSVSVPWAGALVVATLLVTTRALSLSMHTRLAGTLFYAGWLIATALLAIPNPSGDVVFTADVAAYGYLLAGTVLGGAAAAWPLFLDPPADPVDPDSAVGGVGDA